MTEQKAGRKLRILQVNKAYYPHIGGIESLVRTFSRAFSRRPDAEVQLRSALLQAGVLNSR